jgi:hypothetical protein
MKYLSYLLLLATSAFFYSCACTKKMCINYYSVRLIGFSASDIAGAKSISGSDSADLRISISEDSSFYYLEGFEIAEGNTTPLTYSFPAAGRTFVLSDFQFEKQNCNKCTVGYDKYTQFSGCKVNGEEQRGNVIVLNR